MDAITASLERSLQNCSLNNNHYETSRRREKEGSADVDDDDDVVVVVDNHVLNSETTLELNSHLSLPYHWEQCLDLKTGEIYYINWRNGMKAKEDPRRMISNNNTNRNDGNEESDEEEESWDDSEESSSESCCPSSSSNNINNNKEYHHQNNTNNNNVLVVAGCKGCLMYFMVPKQVEDCPKCTGQLLHFDRSQTNNPISSSPSP